MAPTTKGWVARPEERAAVEQGLTALTGRELAAVRYVELPYGEGPMWDAGRFDSVDWGVELEFADGATHSITWQQDSYNETLLVYPGTVRSRLDPAAETAVWDVTDRWREHLPAGVAGVETVWAKHEWGPAMGGPRWDVQLDDGHESDYCLVSLLLAGGNGARIVVTLGGDASDGRGSFVYLADTVAVFFSLAEARACGAWLPGDPGTIP